MQKLCTISYGHSVIIKGALIHQTSLFSHSKRTQPCHPEMQCYPSSSEQMDQENQDFFMKSDNRVAKGTQLDYWVTFGCWYKPTLLTY